MRWLDWFQAYDETPRGTLTALAEAVLLLVLALASLYWGLQLGEYVLEGWGVMNQTARDHMQDLHFNQRRKDPSPVLFIALALVSLVMVLLGALGALIAPLWTLSILKRMFLPPAP